MATGTYCVCITPSPPIEIMNSQPDTTADEGIFEHSKSERGEGEREKKNRRGGERGGRIKHSQN